MIKLRVTVKATVLLISYALNSAWERLMRQSQEWGNVFTAPRGPDSLTYLNTMMKKEEEGMKKMQ